MPRLEELSNQSDDLSEKISTQSRNLAFGFIAASWIVLTSHDGFLHSFADATVKYACFISVISSSVVILMDFIQYVALLIVVRRALGIAIRKKLNSVGYDIDSLAAKVHIVTFYCKTASILVAFFSFATSFVRLLLHLLHS